MENDLFPTLVDPLTPRELVILRRLSEDYSNAEIASMETLAISSVKWYVKQICEKLGTKNRRQAVTRGRELGLLAPTAAGMVLPPIREAVAVANAQDLPTGLVTFLFTDIQDSTPLWEQMPEAMEIAVAQHHRLLRQVIEANGGQVYQIIGDGFQSAFRLASDGLNAALTAQRALRTATWGATGPIKVRMGLHTGPAERDLVGNAPYAVSHTLNRAARVMACGHGGQVLLSQETAALVMPELPKGLSLRDLGEHHLKGLQRKEHLYQALAPDLPQDFSPLVTLDRARNNLPRRRTPYVGRSESIELVQAWLEEASLVTLTGSGGIGKTSLAIQVAEASLDQTPDGAWLVELATVTDPGQVVKSIFTALGLQEEASRPPLETLLDYLRSKSTLILLDNCEHLLETCARLADLLIGNCPKLRLLATSREPLNVSGEKIYRVPSMRFPDPDNLPDIEQFEQFEAVLLFVDCAQSVQPGFAVTEQNAWVIAQVCQRLDGIPLAIELAAARLNVLSITQLAARLDQVFRLLTGGARTALPRQQTLRAAIDWSYQLLNEAERVLLRRLAVFSGTCDLEAAEAVCGFGALEFADILNLLSSLLNKSLLTADTKPKAGMRYRMLEIVRQYAREKLLDAGEIQQVRDRHLDFYVDFMERGEPQQFTTGAMEWNERMKVDLANIRDAMDWAHQDPSAAVKALRIGATMPGWTVSFQGSVREDIDWLEKSLKLVESQPVPALLQAKIMYALALRYMFIKDYQNRLAWSEKCIQLCRQIGPAADGYLSLALNHYGGSVAKLTRDRARALSLKDEAVQVARRLGPDGTFILAVVLSGRGKYAEDPRQGYLDALESYRLFLQSGNRWMAALALLELGYYAEMQKDYPAAQKHYEEGLALVVEIEATLTSSLTIHLGRLYRKMGDYDSAAAYMAEYVRLWSRFGSRERLVDGFASLAILEFCRLGESEDRPAGLTRLTVLIAAAEAQRTLEYEYLLDEDPVLFNQAQATARSELGERVYQHAWERGQVMSLDDAAAFAMQ